MLKTDLCGEWTLISPDGKKLRGHVPGCVHTDLFSLHELYFDRGADKCAFIEDGDWTYERHFTAEKYPAGAEPVLVFEGLDTYAEIILNGNRLGFTDDMFIKYEFSVDGLLLPGENVLTVKFSSPTRRVAGLPPRPGAFTTERLYTRRMQCTYGWDWVARYVTEGHFAAGSMLPKVQAAMKFVRADPDKKAIITSLDKAIDALNGKTGTVVTFA